MQCKLCSNLYPRGYLLVSDIIFLNFPEVFYHLLSFLNLGAFLRIVGVPIIGR